MAMPAAIVAKTAQQQEKYAKVKVVLFSASLDPQSLQEASKTLGLRDIHHANGSTLAAQAIAEDLKLGRQLQITKTPTLFLINEAGQVYEIHSLLALPDLLDWRLLRHRRLLIHSARLLTLCRTNPPGLLRISYRSRSYHFPRARAVRLLDEP